ncbi:MAG TPA: isocitrate lyase/phosphoenolpyruvate mutase family protein [Acidimicrobiales bacterium]|jgi:2-methylisocitrate lyase-like PEP mutase family enzyme|nr:isocitrate lyase/phosphoenolpyruvate mutase family protein [Acidimicrobiales bacterium]
MDQSEKAKRFLELHEPGQPLLMANAWDAGSARILESLGYQGLATTSSGFAATLGKLDGAATLEEVLAHCAAVAAATGLPVSADFENGYAHEPEAVAANYELAMATGLAGASIEDYSADKDDPIYEASLAAERVAAAVAVAHAGPVHFVITARTEIYLRGRPNIDEALERLASFKDAGADVLFAPGMTDPEEIRRTTEIGLPVNVLLRPNGPSVAELAELGVARTSVGGSFAFLAYAGLVEAATALLERQSTDWYGAVAEGGRAARTAFS